MAKAVGGKNARQDGLTQRLEQVAQALSQQVAAMEKVQQVLAVVAEPRHCGSDDGQWVDDVAKALVLVALGLDGRVTGPVAPTTGRRAHPGRLPLPSPGLHDLGAVFLDETPMAVVEIATQAHRGDSVIVAVGIDPKGTKRVLGYRRGSSHDRVAATAICQELYARGLCAPEGTRLLALTDAAGAIDQALVERFPHAAIGHCQRAVEDDVLAHLPSDMRPDARRELRSVWESDDLAQAESDLAIVCDEWTPFVAGGRGALWAQLNPTLTVRRLGIGPALTRSLRTLCVLRTAVAECRRLGAAAVEPGEDPCLWGVEGWHSRTRRVIGHEDMAALSRALGPTAVRPSV